MANQNHLRLLSSWDIVEIAARHGESSRLKSRKENPASAEGNQPEMAAATAPESSRLSSATFARTPIVPTIDSFAENPERLAAVACHPPISPPKPSGRNIQRILFPTTASSESLGFTSPKCPLAMQ